MAGVWVRFESLKARGLRVFKFKVGRNWPVGSTS